MKPVVFVWSKVRFNVNNKMYKILVNSKDFTLLHDAEEIIFFVVFKLRPFDMVDDKSATIVCYV